MAAFAEVALDLYSLGLAPTPTGGEDGKRPLMRGYSTNRLGSRQLAELTHRSGFREANVALVTGPSELNVVDIDDPKLLKEMLLRFGESPLITQTGGRCGYQVFYRATSYVRPTDLRISDGIPVEIKADGNIVVVPPSTNWRTGRPYRFVEGRFDRVTIDLLPPLRVSSIFETRTSAEHHRICEGHRNNWLFSTCLREARYVDTLDELIDAAKTRNDELLQPLGEAEVTKTAQSAWRYQENGKNFASGHGGLHLNRNQLDQLIRSAPGNPIAFLLFLQSAHAARGQRGETFAIARRAMTEAGSLPGWTEKQIRGAKEALVRLGLIKQLDQPHGMPTQYTFPRKD